MAVCEIWDVRGRLDHPIDYAENPEKTANPKYTEADLQALGDVMKYATNGDKTEKQFFVTGVNCDTATARDEMLIAKAQWNDESEIVCYHGFQSFKSGELTPEQAHEVGVKLAEKMWGDRFQVIVATHLNTDCLHNHFVVNSVSFADGKHYHDNKANLRLLRQHSDELCREYALSVIEHPNGRKKPYALYQAEKQGLPTRDNVARQAVDEAISKSFTLKDFNRLGRFQPQPQILDDYRQRLETPQAVIQARRGLHQRENYGAYPRKLLCRKVRPICRANKAGQGVPCPWLAERRKENWRLAWTVSPLLLQARYPAERQKTKLCEAPLSSQRRPYEDGRYHKRNKVALPLSH